MKHVYVFGAGASTASADTPLGRDLVWNYHLDCGLMVPINNGVPDLSEENENFTNFRKFLELCSSIYPEFKNLIKEWDGRGELIFHLYDRIEKKHYVDELRLPGRSYNLTIFSGYIIAQLYWTFVENVHKLHLIPYQVGPI